MNFQEALDYLYSRLPMYQRIGASAFKKNLDNTLALCEHLSNPQHNFKSIHIAGTNGKGSSAHMLASVLQQAGYDTGLYTSPHLKSFTERVRVNGEEVPQSYISEFVKNYRNIIDAIQPSFFEVTVAMAFDYFSQMKVDIAIIETGLGGRLDSTNVILPELSLITSIGYDHMDLLGDTLPQIASEKAGIIKHQIPAVISNYQEEIAHVFEQKAAGEQAPLYFADQIMKIEKVRYEKHRTVFDVYRKGVRMYKNLALDLRGSYQINNLPGVLLSLDLLPLHDFTIDISDLRKGLANVQKNTGLKGRWQKLGENPAVYCDTAHNVDGIAAMLQTLQMQTFDQLHLVWGMVQGKEADKILKLLPNDAKYYFCAPQLPRALPVADLADAAGKVGLQGLMAPSVNQALEMALSNAGKNDLVFVGGSTFVVAELENL
ncbi:MAG: bifunctional folylpolyglutamate synthase/dihydrofolate synthase [Cyclobacteriaceae bacterium]|nr:bifunctional folylpolyglutamate synthase/dihydrofolate synthase [Cyclobacteriaceae bacterium]